MITCRQLIEFLDVYLAGDLEPRTQAEVRRHIALCEDCANYVDSYRRCIVLAWHSASFDLDAPIPNDVPLGLVRAALAGGS